MAEQKENEQRKTERVVVDIFGQTYALKTDEPETAQRLAASVDAHMKRVAHRANSFDGQKIAVLAALQIAEEYEALKKDYDELVEFLNEK